MTEQGQIYRLSGLRENNLDELNRLFSQIAQRLDAIEGLRGELNVYADIDMHNNQIIDLADGDDATDAATKGQLDDEIQTHDHSGGNAGVGINHNNLMAKGTNSHEAIDTFIASKGQANGLAPLNSAGYVDETRIPDLTDTYAEAAKGVTNGDSHDHNGGDGAVITVVGGDGSNVAVGHTSTPFDQLDVRNGGLTIDYSTGGTAGSAAWFVTNAASFLLIANAYYSGAYKYSRTGGAGYIDINISTSASAGDITFRTAASGVADAAATITERMRLTQAGNLKLPITGAAPAATANMAYLYVADIAAGQATFHMANELGNYIIPCWQVKTTTGDPASGFPGLIVENTFDNTLKAWVDGAFRTLASGW